MYLDKDDYLNFSLSHRTLSPSVSVQNTSYVSIKNFIKILYYFDIKTFLSPNIDFAT